MRRSSREIPFYVHSKRRPGRMRLSTEALQVALSVLHLELKRIVSEACRWKDVIDKATDLDDAGVRQAIGQHRSCVERIAGIERLIGSLEAMSYTVDDVEDAWRLAGETLCKSVFVRCSDATVTGSSQLEGE
jgi:hypothetical protein